MEQFSTDSWFYCGELTTAIKTGVCTILFLFGRIMQYLNAINSTIHKKEWKWSKADISVEEGGLLLYHTGLLSHLLSELTRIISNMGYKYVNSLFGWLYECPQNSHIQYIYIQNCDPADPWCRTLEQQKRALLFLHASTYIFFFNQGGKRTYFPSLTCAAI